MENMDNALIGKRRTLLQGLLSERTTNGARPEEELGQVLRSRKLSFQNMQSGLSKVLTLEPLTTVKDLVIVGDGPAAEEIFQYCEDQTVRANRRGLGSDEQTSGGSQGSDVCIRPESQTVDTA